MSHKRGEDRMHALFLKCAHIIKWYDKGRKGLALGHGTVACLHKTGII